jgi:hypothetical protein
MDILVEQLDEKIEYIEQKRPELKKQFMECIGKLGYRYPEVLFPSELIKRYFISEDDIFKIRKFKEEFKRYFIKSIYCYICNDIEFLKSLGISEENAKNISDIHYYKKPISIMFIIRERFEEIMKILGYFEEEIKYLDPEYVYNNIFSEMIYYDEFIEELDKSLELGFNINYESKEHGLLLKILIEKEEFDLVDKLIKRGANICQKIIYLNGKTLLNCAEEDKRKVEERIINNDIGYFIDDSLRKNILEINYGHLKDINYEIKFIKEKIKEKVNE